MDLINQKWQTFATTGKVADYLAYCNLKTDTADEEAKNTGGENIGSKQGTS